MDNTAQHDRILESLTRNLGAAFIEALSDPLTIEVMLNPNGVLFQERLGEAMKVIGSITPVYAMSALNTMATMLDTNITVNSPILEGELPIDGSRLAAWIPPIVSAPSFAIRKKASKVFSLDNYVSSTALPADFATRIKEAVSQKLNILIVGGTGTGKTTFTNAVIKEISTQFPDERIVIIQDTPEIQCEVENKVFFNTSRNVSMTHLLKTTLRARPDRILVGEVRGPEALDLLDAWSTGHPGGVATLHADSAEKALRRLNSLVTRNPAHPNDINALIAETVQMIVHIVKTPEGRKIKSLMEIHGFEDGKFLTTIHERK
jgi:type IV secretion system protein VirB11